MVRTVLNSFKRGCERHGREVKFVPGSVPVRGAEAILTGNESGAITAKGFFHETDDAPSPEGQLSGLRVANVRRTENQDWHFRSAATYFTTVPTSEWRLVDGGETYSIVEVRPVYRRQTPIIYEFRLRLIGR